MGLKNEAFFWKTKCFHLLSSTLTKNKRKKTINTTFISSHVCLKSGFSHFWNVSVLFLQENIFGHEKLFPPPVKNKAITLKWKEELKLADMVL